MQQRYELVKLEKYPAIPKIQAFGGIYTMYKSEVKGRNEKVQVWSCNDIATH